MKIQIQKKKKQFDTTGFRDYFDCVEVVIRKVEYIFLFVDISYEITPNEFEEYLQLIERVKNESSQIIIIGTKNEIKKWRKNKEDELEYIVGSKYQYCEISSKENNNVLYPLFLIVMNENKCLENNKKKSNEICSLL